MKVFQTLSSREQKLLRLTAMIALAFFVWQFVIRPVLSSNAQARAKYESAVRDQELVRHGAQRLKQIMPSIVNTMSRSDIVALSHEQNLQITRLQPDGDMQLSIWLNDVEVKGLYNWLYAAQKQFGGQILRADISKNTNGKLDAHISFKLGS